MRTPCCVPFCRCSTKNQYQEWICSKHWSLVPKPVRREWQAQKRLVKKILRRKPLYAEWWKYPGGSVGRLAGLGMWKRVDREWNKVKAAAIEGAAGI